MNVYVASPLFTAAERAFNLGLADALERAGHRVYLPQRDTPEPSGPGRTRTIFDTNLRALQEADVVVAVCDGAAVDDGTAWEVGYAVGRDIPVVGLRTDSRITQPDERINLMILEGLAQLTPSIETVVETLRAWEGRDAGAAP